MDCCEFREKYSDFADGLLEEADEYRARQHLSECAACRRFDAAFQAGVSTLRGLPSVQVSRSFADRLRNRLRRELAVRALAVDPWSGAVGALLVVATVGVVALDLVELRAAKHPGVSVAHSVDSPQATALMARRDSEPYPQDMFHPLHPALLVADTNGALDFNHPRFDIPAVWGGR